MHRGRKAAPVYSSPQQGLFRALPQRQLDGVQGQYQPRNATKWNTGMTAIDE